MFADLHVFALDAFGWFFFLISFSIPLTVSALRRDQTALIAAWVTVFLHDSGAIINCYLARIPSDLGDAITFHHAAIDFATMKNVQASVANEPYLHFLGTLYTYCGTSEFLGCEAAVLGFSLSLLPFTQLIGFLNLRRWQAQLILFYGLLPAKLLYCCVTLRESYQALFFLTLVSCISMIRQDYKRTLPYFGAVLSAFSLASLHGGLALCGFLIIGIGCLWTVSEHSKITAIFVAILLSVCFLPGSPLLSALAGHSGLVKSIESGNFSKYTEGYRENIGEGRANYGLSLDLSSPFGILITFPPVFIYYMFSPLPWQVGGLNDLYGLLESLLRMTMFLGAVVHVRNAEPQVRPRVAFIFISYMLVECIWSAGSSNWGQSIRHHVVAWGLLVLLGAPTCLLYFSKDSTNYEAD